jgi:hypothetical protein
MRGKRECFLIRGSVRDQRPGDGFASFNPSCARVNNRVIDALARSISGLGGA